MSKSKINARAIKENRKRIFKLDAEVMTNKANAYLSRSMIEENRMMKEAQDKKELMLIIKYHFISRYLNNIILSILIIYAKKLKV